MGSVKIEVVRNAQGQRRVIRAVGARTVLLRHMQRADPTVEPLYSVHDLRRAVIECNHIFLATKAADVPLVVYLSDTCGVEAAEFIQTMYNDDVVKEEGGVFGYRIRRDDGEQWLVIGQLI